MKIMKRLRRPVQRLLAKVSLTPAETALATDVVGGISEAKSCHLSKIARTLKEKVPLIQTEQRLSRQLAKKLSNLDSLPRAWLRHAAPVTKRMSFIAVDFSEISKPYGKKFEHIDRVRDASTPKKEIQPGYWLLSLEAGDQHHARLALWMEAFSTKASSYQGWWETVHRAILAVRSSTDPQAVWLFDRGFDDKGTMRVADKLGLRWVIRVKRNRNVSFGDPTCRQTKNLATFANGLRCSNPVELEYVDKSTHVLCSFPASFGFAPVVVSQQARTLLVVRLPGHEDMFLLTHQRGLSKKQAALLVKAYLKRWGNEETTRCLKQCTQVEDVRVRRYQSIQRIVSMAMVALGLQAMWWFTRRTSTERLIQRVKQFIENVPFPPYRWWEATSDALSHGS